MSAKGGPPPAGAKKPGRPTRYRPEFAQQARKLCLLGATDADLAGFFEVNEATVNNWKAAHPEFFESLKAGKLDADAKVAESLYRLALGYSHPEEKLFLFEGQVIRAETVKHYPPSATACIFWLKNRQPANWRDKVEVRQEADVRVIPYDQLKDITAAGLAFAERRYAEITGERADLPGLELGTAARPA